MRFGGYDIVKEQEGGRKEPGLNNREKINANDLVELTDDELGEIAGGTKDADGDEIIYGNNGFMIGQIKRCTGEILYWKCTHCGLPVYHTSAAYWCDKCDDWWVSRSYYTWNGTKEELIAANARTL